MLPEEQERRKRSLNVVIMASRGGCSACLRQAAQEVFQAPHLPRGGQHLVAVEPLPTRAPHPPLVVGLDHPCWSTGLLRSKCNLRRLPAPAKVYIAEHLTRTQQAERLARQLMFAAAQQLGRAFWRGLLHPQRCRPWLCPRGLRLLGVRGRGLQQPMQKHGSNLLLLC